MDAEITKEQISNPFVWVGALEVFLGGRGPSGVSTPESKRSEKKAS